VYGREESLLDFMPLWVLTTASAKTANVTAKPFKPFFHWLLVKGTYPMASEDEYLIWRLRNFVFPKSENYLKIICSFILSRKLIGLPLEILNSFIQLMKESEESLVLNQIDILFGHFIRLEPSKTDEVYPMSQADRHNTLTKLVKFAHGQYSRYKSAHWRGVLISWRNTLMVTHPAKIPNCAFMDIVSDGIVGDYELNAPNGRESTSANLSDPSHDMTTPFEETFNGDSNDGDITLVDLGDLLQLLEDSLAFGGGTTSVVKSEAQVFE